MIAAWCSAIAVLALGGALRPRPSPRRPGDATLEPQSFTLPVLRSRRRAAVDAADVAAWCESLARVVRGGSTLITALHTVEPPASCRDAIDPIILSLRRGGRLRDALDLATRAPHLDLAVTVLRACAVNGGPPAEPLDRAAATLRGRATDLADRRTQSAQARLSARVMTILPIAMLALLLATSATTRAAATSTTGLAAIAIGGVLNVAGWRWMRHIIGEVDT
jgi:tight adherence protein B